MDSRSARVVKNTFFTYFRMILIMVVSLYTSRVVLANLGVSDFGLYNVVGGLIALFSFINNAMAQATQRYITYALGQGSQENVKKVFSQSFFIHLGLALIILLIAEIFGTWYISNYLVVDEGREAAAWVIFHISMVITFIGILFIPFRATIVAYEHLSTFAYISILEAILKLVVAFAISISDYDKLITYGFLMLAVTVIIHLSYFAYCFYRFPTARIVKVYDKALFKKMTSFAGWSLMGGMSAVGCSQGLNLIINAFFNTVVNAAIGISTQVRSVIHSFAQNFYMAVNPQITKSYAANDREYFMKLIYRSSRYSFYLYFIVAFPFLLGTDYILNLWLVEVPPHAVNISRIMLCITAIDVFSTPLNVGIQATGMVKYFEIITSLVLLSIIPLSYLALKFLLCPEIVYIIYFTCVGINFSVRLLIARKRFSLSIHRYTKEVLMRAVLVIFLSSIIPMSLYLLHLPQLWVITTALFSVCGFICFVGLYSDERSLLQEIIKNKIRR